MKKWLLLFVFFGLLVSHVQGQAFEWVKRYPASNIIGTPEGINAVSIDADASSLIFSGFFRDSIRIGNNLYQYHSGSIQNPTNNSYLIKYGAEGNLLWSKHIGGGPVTNVTSKLDAAGNIIVTGIFKDSLTIGSTLFKSTYNSIFIIKLDAGGNIIWAKNSTCTPLIPIPPSMIMQGRYIKFDLDLAGNIYVGGGYTASITFSNTTISNPVNFNGAYTHSFLLKYDTSGNLIWLRDLDPNGFFELAATDQGELYYLGWNGDFIRKLNTNGDSIWTKSTPTYSMSPSFRSAGVDKAGNAYISGVFNSQTTLGNFTIPSVPTAPLKPAYYVAKISPSGTWKWVQEYTPSTVSGIPAINLPDRITKVFSVAGQFLGSLKVADSTFTAPSRQIFIAKMDTSGNVLQARRIISKNSSNYLLHPEYVAMDPYGNTYLTGCFNNSATIGNFSFTTGPTFLTRYLTKLQDYSNTVTGNVFHDANLNGLKDTGELTYPDKILEILPGPVYTTTLPNGNYGIFLPVGNFNIAMQAPKHYLVAPLTHTVNFSNANQAVTGKNFALQPIPNRPDVKINLSPVTPARPGFNLIHNITYSNVGTTTLSDSIVLTYNSNLIVFSTALPAAAHVKPGRISWYYSNLKPTEKRSISLQFMVNTTTPMNSVLKSVALIRPLSVDLFPSDNLDTLVQVVTNSYDPNDKKVNFAYLTPAQLSATPYLDYTIRFQNKGTDTAFTVVVRDVFTGKQDIPSFEMVSASHPYSFRMLENNIAEWRFDNILLPHSNRNEPASHGFIRYRIKPKTNLVLGDEIKSRAAIYFDFNSPIMTNYATTRIQNPTGIKERNIGISTFNLYPNPAKDFAIMEAELTFESPVTLKLTNLLGQQVFEKQIAKSQKFQTKLDTGNLTKGVYLLGLQTEKGVVTKRLVIQ